MNELSCFISDMHIPRRSISLCLFLFCLLHSNIRADFASRDSLQSEDRKRPFRLSYVKTENGKINGYSLVPGLYRSYLSLFRQYKTPDELYIWDEKPVNRYSLLIKEALPPGTIITELTTYPLPWIIITLENKAPQFVSRFNIGDFNLISNLGEGYQEPWSLSLFWGEMRSYYYPDTKLGLIPVASGIAGIVITGGTMQIFDHAFIKAGWYRIELKLKGEGYGLFSGNSWDIKIGYRHYGIAAIEPSLILSFRQILLSDHKTSWYSPENLALNFEIQKSVFSGFGHFNRVLISLAKFNPYGKIKIGLSGGMDYKNRRIYDPSTHTFSASKRKDIDVFLQPQIHF